MRIALVSDWFLPRLGGVELQIRDLAGELAAAGHEVHVVTTTPADHRAQGSLQTGPVDVPEGVAVHRADVALLPKAGFTISPRAGLEMRKILSRIAPDVVHLHASICSTGTLAGAWAAHRLRVPSVVTFHSVLGRYRQVLRAADVAFGWSRWPRVFSAVSSALAGEVASLSRGRPVEVLPNGIDLSEWSVDPVPGPRDELRLVSVLRLQARKRGLPLVRVMAGAATRLRDVKRVHLTVIGDGPERGVMEAEARRLGIGDSIEFTGYLPRSAIRARFARADAFVLVSVLESFGIAALEARAAGLPVVARRDTGMSELLEHGKEAILAATDEGVIDALVRLAKDPQLLASIARNNREVAPAVSWASSLPRHLELYQQALGA